MDLFNRATPNAPATPYLAPPTCFLCNGGEYRLVHAWPAGDPWNPTSLPLAVWRCAGCGIVSLHPRPRTEDFPVSDDWWEHPHRKVSRNQSWRFLHHRLGRGLFGEATDRLLWSTRRVVGSGRLLDVGCGRGDLMVKFAAGYPCEGLEPSALAARGARERGFKVMETTLEKAELPHDTYDVVTLDAVIEHFDDPMVAMKKVGATMRPGGVVVLRTPKMDGPSCRLYGRTWNGYRVGFHTHMFNIHTLEMLLRRSGLEAMRRPRRNRWFDDILIVWGRKPLDRLD